MDKKEVIFLAASLFMLKHYANKDIVNPNGRDDFKKSFSIYQHLLEDLYDTSPGKNLKK